MLSPKFSCACHGRTSSQILKRAQFNPEAGLKVTPDIIEGHEEIETLRQQFDLISAIVGHAADGLYTVDPRGHFTFINPAAARMLGWEAGELLGRHVHETIHFQHPDGTPCSAEECPLLNVLRSGESISSRPTREWKTA